MLQDYAVWRGEDGKNIRGRRLVVVASSDRFIFEHPTNELHTTLDSSCRGGKQEQRPSSGGTSPERAGVSPLKNKFIAQAEAGYCFAWLLPAEHHAPQSMKEPPQRIFSSSLAISLT
jgi:hypothetical protein